MFKDHVGMREETGVLKISERKSTDLSGVLTDLAGVLFALDSRTATGGLCACKTSCCGHPNKPGHGRHMLGNSSLPSAKSQAMAIRRPAFQAGGSDVSKWETHCKLLSRRNDWCITQSLFGNDPNHSPPYFL